MQKRIKSCIPALHTCTIYSIAVYIHKCMQHTYYMYSYIRSDVSLYIVDNIGICDKPCIWLSRTGRCYYISEIDFHEGL